MTSPQTAETHSAYFQGIQFLPVFFISSSCEHLSTECWLLQTQHGSLSFFCEAGPLRCWCQAADVVDPERVLMAATVAWPLPVYLLLGLEGSDGMPCRSPKRGSDRIFTWRSMKATKTGSIAL